MEKTLLLSLIAVSLLSCTEVRKNPIPTDTTEWTIKLASPVLAQHQETEDFFLPEQVYHIFSADSLNQIYFSAASLKNANNLPGDYSGWCRSSDNICWPIKDIPDWNYEKDPKNYLYIIDYQNQFIAIWFIDSVTLQCKKLKKPMR